MICGFCNSMSISAPGRKLFIDYNLVPLNLDYIGFQETKKEEFTISFLKNLLGNIIFCLESLASHMYSWRYSGRNKC
jgi:hypothetical protein